MCCESTELLDLPPRCDASRTQRLHACHGLIERARRVYAEVAGA